MTDNVNILPVTHHRKIHHNLADMLPIKPSQIKTMDKNAQRRFARQLTLQNSHSKQTNY